MGAYERFQSSKVVEFNGSVNSEPIDIRGWEIVWLLIKGGLSSATINIEAQDSQGNWHPVLDETGTQVVVPATANGYVPIHDVPTMFPIRFVLGGAITEESLLSCRS